MKASQHMLSQHFLFSGETKTDNKLTLTEPSSELKLILKKKTLIKIK